MYIVSLCVATFDSFIKMKVFLIIIQNKYQGLLIKMFVFSTIHILYSHIESQQWHTENMFNGMRITSWDTQTDDKGTKIK